ncbi:protein NEGATIVE REGULATOR OF RESISTANCE-like [Canna indica]|uniref:Protein NEGATIVE REGULATOR OF RESISTANCE-like n=1 Tax=Canna indica TaxID=4628 RepID=A0AAQ3Q9N5_9LILI|nr:protein NEGATIVE REGULATOR OF RESISTANCE-like [Canna indica]
MESSKRKRRGGDDDDRRRPSKPPPPADPKVTDDEVEEFFTILRQMRHATRSISTAARSEPPPAADPRWSPAFALEDFVGPDGAEGDGAKSDREASAERPREENAEAQRCLDLNADPEPEGLAGTSPGGGSTARCAQAPA